MATLESHTVHEGFELKLEGDETVDDSDKTFTIPALVYWQILWIWVELITTADQGDRQLELQIQDSANDIIYQQQVSVVQPATLTRNYLFAPGLADLLGFRDTTFLTTPIPPTLFLPAGYQIRIWDNNAVAAAADDMNVQMQVAEFGQWPG